MSNQGDWPMGKFLDIYWNFNYAGDYFLGRVVCGLDPNKSGRVTIPPHLIEKNRMDDEDNKSTMCLMYVSVLEKYKDNTEINPTDLFLVALTSVINHSNW